MSLPSIPDYSSCIKMPTLLLPQLLNGGHPIEKGTRLIKYSGGFCVVFPYETATRKYAIRCWHAEISNAKRRTQIISEALKNSQLPYFVGFEFYEDGIRTPQGLQPIVVMDWVEAQPLKKYLSEHLEESNVINEIAENFKKMVSDLHACHLSHGDLQHGNIMINSDRSLVLVDYDSMYVPKLKGMPDEIKGLVGYQHEARWKNKFASEKADYFSELVIYLSLKALAKRPSLWTRLNMADTDTLLFSGDDIRSKGSANIFNELRTDLDLAPLVDKLCEFMGKTSIDDLMPLEEAIVSKAENISSKWKCSNGYIGVSSNSCIDDTEKIIKKWRGGNGYVKPDKNEQYKKIALSISKKIKS